MQFNRRNAEFENGIKTYFKNGQPPISSSRQGHRVVNVDAHYCVRQVWVNILLKSAYTKVSELAENCESTLAPKFILRVMRPRITDFKAASEWVQAFHNVGLGPEHLLWTVVWSFKAQTVIITDLWKWWELQSMTASKFILGGARPQNIASRAALVAVQADHHVELAPDHLMWAVFEFPHTHNWELRKSSM